MHVVHYPKNTDADGKAKKDPATIGGVVGIFFDTKAGAELTPTEESVVDTFFETLKWSETTDPKVSMVSFANMMAILDYKNRWTYLGSLTTPPCSTGIYWNVIRKVLPIKQKHLDGFRKT